MRSMMLTFVMLITGALLAQDHAHSNRSDDDRVQIAVSLGVDCPISQKYVSTLNRIYNQFKDRPEFTWCFFIPGLVTRKEMREFVSSYDVKFPLAVDRKFVKTESFDMSVTPEVIIRSQQGVLYQGAIDNWFYELGRYRPEATEHYLINAIDAILRREEPTIKQKEAIGCLIQRPQKSNGQDHDH